MTLFELYAVFGAPAILIALMALVYYGVDAKFLRLFQGRDTPR
jgi:hypothetical protein